MTRLRIIAVAVLVGLGVLAASVASVGAAALARPAAVTGLSVQAEEMVPALSTVVSRPAAVTGLSVQAGETPGELEVSWDSHPGDVVDYRVKWARVGESFRKISDTDWNAFPVNSELTISGLSPGDSYKVRVRARFDGPNGKWSPAVTGTAAPEAPPAEERAPIEETTAEKKAPEHAEEKAPEPAEEALPEPAKESSPVTTRDHVPERSFELDTRDSASCGASACSSFKTYSVSLTGGQKYVAEIWGSSTVGGGDATKLAITAVRSPNGAKLGSDLSGLQITLREPKVIFTASSTPGTHTVEVRIDMGGRETNTFRVVVYPYVPDQDCKANIRTTCTVTVGTPQSGELGVNSLSRSDVDWFAVDLTGGQLYEIVLRRDTTTHLAVRDPFLKGVYDDRGRLLHTDGSVYPFPHFGATGGTADSNSGPGNTALTYFTANSTGTYYIGVTSAGGKNRAGHYILSVRTYSHTYLANDDCPPGRFPSGFNAYSELIFRHTYCQRLGMPPTQEDYDAASLVFPGRFTQCEIRLGQTVTGRIEHNGILSNRFSGSTLVPGDRDWWAIYLDAGTRYRIEVETRAGGMHNPDLTGIIDDRGSRVHDGNGSRGDSPYSERIDFEPAEERVHYIEVAGPASSGPYNTGRYWLTITELP